MKTFKNDRIISRGLYGKELNHLTASKDDKEMKIISYFSQ